MIVEKPNRKEEIAITSGATPIEVENAAAVRSPLAA